MKVTAKEKEFPVLLSYQVNDRQVAVWCPYCIDWHYHGVHDGHVAAHCYKDDSPFKKRGYVIKRGNKKDYKTTI